MFFRHCHLQVFAYSKVDVEHRDPRIRIHDTERTVRQLNTDLRQWANTSISSDCYGVFQNLTDRGTLSESLQRSSEESSRLEDCLQTTSQHFGSLTSVLVRGAQHFISRNGQAFGITAGLYLILSFCVQWHTSDHDMLCQVTPGARDSQCFKFWTWALHFVLCRPPYSPPWDETKALRLIAGRSPS